MKKQIQIHTQILGHRGAKGERLENSLAGFKHAECLVDVGLSGIEFDIQLTSDNNLIVFHDSTLDRIYKRQDRIDQLQSNFFEKYSPIFSYKKQKILHLKEMPEFLTKFLHIELEIKTHERTNYKKLVSTLTQELSQFPKNLPITLTSFDINLLYKLKFNTQLAHFERGLLIEEGSLPSFCNYSNNAIIDMANALNCSHIAMDKEMINSNLVALSHQKNISITAWTVNDLVKCHDLINMNVDYIISDYPTKILKDLF